MFKWMAALVVRVAAKVKKTHDDWLVYGPVGGE
jgi:hypothetical protein